MVGWILKMHPFHLWRAELPTPTEVHHQITPNTPDVIKRKLIYVIDYRDPWL